MTAKICFSITQLLKNPNSMTFAKVKQSSTPKAVAPKVLQLNRCVRFNRTRCFLPADPGCHLFFAE
ncbi:UNVERIFIED_CONTAM: hypothetical protein GTU68_063732 [Idotea baltica]|nr:hypothetical protein [Idotea baltica]